MRQNKFNFFATGNYYRSGGETDGKVFRQNNQNGIIDSIDDALDMIMLLKSKGSKAHGGTDPSFEGARCPEFASCPCAT